MRFRRFLLVWTIGAVAVMAQVTAPLRSTAGHDAVRASSSGDSFSPLHEVHASFQATMLEATEGKRGEAWLVFSADSADVPKTEVTIRIPLSSTEDAYGESRACRVGKDGVRRLEFTAGLDEANFVTFTAAKDSHDYSFLLNKYLCRVLAAPFHCGEKEVALPKNWATWRMARKASVRLSSDAPAAMRVSPVFLTSSEKAFDYQQCAVVAPSNGLCCVMGKETAWHCGGKPEGEGWHQVSGECWHRETGSACPK